MACEGFHAVALLARLRPLPAALETAWMARLPPARRAVLAARPVERRQASLIAHRLLDHGLRLAPGMARRSVSHGGDRVLVALAAGPVGVDVEAVGPVAAGFRRYLDDAERDWAGDDPRRFATLWTAKEAVAKAAGDRGLADVPRVRVDAAAGIATLDGDAWRLHGLAVGAGRVACAALRPADAPPTLLAVPMRVLADNRGFPVDRTDPR